MRKVFIDVIILQLSNSKLDDFLKSGLDLSRKAGIIIEKNEEGN